MKIFKAKSSDANEIANIVKLANIPVARELNLTQENCAKHPSNCTKEWIIDSMNNGEEYYILEHEKQFVGCVAYQDPKTSECYLNRLAVLPEFQKKGYGEKLVEFHEYLSKENNKKRISIGIIDSNTNLKNWYKKLGFTENGKKDFPHLPFTVCFMGKDLTI